jgi:hypothetical protein
VTAMRGRCVPDIVGQAGIRPVRSGGVIEHRSSHLRFHLSSAGRWVSALLHPQSSEARSTPAAVAEDSLEIWPDGAELRRTHLTRGDATFL